MIFPDIEGDVASYLDEVLEVIKTSTADVPAEDDTDGDDCVELALDIFRKVALLV